MSPLQSAIYHQLVQKYSWHVHDRPGHREARGLAREAADHLGPPADLLERPLQQIGRPETLPQAERIAQVDRERLEIVGETRRRRGELTRELAHEPAQARLGLVRTRGRIERRPVRGPDPAVEVGPLGQLGQDVPKSVHGAPAPVGIGPQLVHRPDQAGRPVGDHEQWAAQATPREAPSQIEPVLGPLALPEADVEQDPVAVGREAPGDEDALLGTVGPDRQVDGVQEQREQAHLAEAAGPEGAVPVAELAADRAHRRPADRAQPRLAGEALDVAVREAPDVGADDERLERPGPDDRARVGDDPRDEPGERVAHLGHGDHDLALGGLDPSRPGAVARSRGVGGPGIAGAPQERLELVLDRALEDELGTQAPSSPSWSGPPVPSSRAASMAASIWTLGLFFDPRRGLLCELPRSASEPTPSSLLQRSQDATTSPPTPTISPTA